MKIFIYAICFLIILSILISMIMSHFKLDITRFNIKNKKIDKNIKIIFLSDLHNRNLANKLKNIINDENPDIIIMGGDMINESLNQSNNFIKLYKLLENNKIYYTFGNHEDKLYYDELEKYTKIISKSNINILNNKSEKLSKNIILYGLKSEDEQYLHFGKLFLNKKYIESKIGKFDKNKFNILIAHNPLEFDSYVDTQADLVLSGHVHGGLIRLPLIGALLSPDYTFFPKYSSGIYKKNNTEMIVSRGLGFSRRLPFRVFNNAEVVIINLIKE